MNSYGHIIHTNLPALLKKCEAYADHYIRVKNAEIESEAMRWGNSHYYPSSATFMGGTQMIWLWDFIEALRWAIDNDIEQMYVAIELIAKVDSYA